MKVRKIRTQLETVSWLLHRAEDANINLFMTLTYRRALRKDDARQAFKELMWRLSCKSFPRSALDRGQRIKCIPFREKGKHYADRPHYHCLIELPEKYSNCHDVFKRIVRKEWLKLRASYSLNTPLCGGDPRQYDPTDSKWFIYEKKGLSFEAQGAIIKYGLKSLRTNELGQFDIDCLDVGNLHL